MPDPNIPSDDEQGVQEPGAAGPGVGPGAAEPAAVGEPEIPALQLRQIIAVLQTDLEAVKAEKMRLLADMDNLRKRVEREKADTAKYAVTKFAQDVVGVVDNFELAASAVPAEAAPASTVIMTSDEVRRALVRIGHEVVERNNGVENGQVHESSFRKRL